MKHISERMLIHSATVYFIECMDADRNPTWTEGTEISKVWFNITKKVGNGSQGKTSEDSGMLFFDSSESLPSDFIPSASMKIVFDNSTFFVSSIHKITDANGTHHFEIGLK